ncbi:hypothetical protein [Pseudomonas sp. SWI36]|uniref:hypothetical protein n=1 Tax=Pseudomonas sp. SWI36 TaxID=2083052 RepID=UPI002114FC2D|nr:hypothetical protein [Pseudomonas sp. SWI36]
MLHPLDLTPTEVARKFHVSALTVLDIVNEKRGVTADVPACRLLRYHATVSTNFQYAYEIRRTEIAHGAQIGQVQKGGANQLSLGSTYLHSHNQLMPNTKPGSGRALLKSYVRAFC